MGSGVRKREWQQRLLGLREAVGELYAAESAALSRDLGKWGKGFGVAVVLLLAALALGFWLLALLVASLVAVLAIWLPVWAASLITSGLVLLVILGLGLLGWSRLRKLGGPIDRVRRRWRDHLAWWDDRVFAPLDEDGDDAEEESPDER